MKKADFGYIQQLGSLVTVIFLVYLYYLMFNVGFFWDDQWAYVDNPQIQNFDLGNVRDIFLYPYKSQYSPVNSLYYLIYFQAFGFDPFGLHLANVLLHILNSILVFFLIKNLLEHFGLDIKERYFFAPLIISIMWGVSPLQVESVAWISASKIVLYSFFFLAGLIFYIKDIKSPNWRWKLIVLVLFLLSFGCKEQAVVFPVILLLIRIFSRTRINLEDVIFLGTMFILAILMGIFTMRLQESGFQEKLESDYYPISDRLVLSSYSITQYVQKSLFPIKLSHDYRFPVEPGISLPKRFYFYLVPIILLFYWITLQVRQKSKSPTLFFIGFFLVTLFLSLHILPLARVTLMADRYMYLPLLGLYGSVVFLLFEWLEDTRGRSTGKYLLLVYIMFLMTTTFLYLKQWTY